jgi:hypothetical protein
LEPTGKSAYIWTQRWNSGGGKKKPSIVGSTSGEDPHFEPSESREWEGSHMMHFPHNSLQREYSTPMLFDTRKTKRKTRD